MKNSLKKIGARKILPCNKKMSTEILTFSYKQHYLCKQVEHLCILGLTYFNRRPSSQKTGKVQPIATKLVIPHYDLEDNNLAT